MADDPGVNPKKGGGWTASITNPKGKVVRIGVYETREEANAAYKERQVKLYPPGPPVEVDPSKHHSLEAAPVGVAAPRMKLH